MIGIYKITNAKNDKVYIGKSTNIEERWKQHKYSLIKSETAWHPLARKEKKTIMTSMKLRLLEL